MKYTEKYKELAEQFRKNGCDEYMIRKFIRQEMEAGEFRKGEGTQIWKHFGFGRDIRMRQRRYGFIMHFVSIAEIRPLSRGTIYGKINLL